MLFVTALSGFTSEKACVSVIHQQHLALCLHPDTEGLISGVKASGGSI